MFRGQQQDTLFEIDFKFQELSNSENPTFLQDGVAFLNDLKADLFPYLRLWSVSTALVFIQVMIFLFVHKSNITIKPMKGFSDPLPWIFCPFATYKTQIQNSQTLGISCLICHTLYSILILSELQQRLRNSFYFILLYLGLCWGTSFFLHLIWAPNMILSCNSTIISIQLDLPSYTLYAYLLVLKDRWLRNGNRLRQNDYQIGEEIDGIDQGENRVEGREDQMVGIFKFIVLSYFIYAALYSSNCCQFVGYISSLVLLFFGITIKVI